MNFKGGISTKPGYRAKWMRDWRKNNKREEQRIRRRYYLRHKELVLQRNREWAQANPEKRKEHSLRGVLKHSYNMTLEEYRDLERKQKGRCAICRKKCRTRNRLSVDHEHKKKRNRGLLCDDCNVGLGRFKDDVAVLERAIAYLKKHSNVPERV